MDIQEYIQSGVIESYVLGLATENEIQQLEKYRSQYTEIDEAIDSFSELLEQESLKNAIEPPVALKAKIIAAIKEETKNNGTPVVPINLQDSDQLVPLVDFRKWRMTAAASIILLFCSAALNYYLYHQYNSKNAAYTALLEERNSLQANNQIYQTTIKDWQQTTTMMADPLMTIVKMQDPAKKADNLATVLWNSANKDVYLVPTHLPHPVHGKQYQLWALVNGKPVDAGMLDPECNGACKMKTIEKAEAFAITLEQEGGSATPTMAALTVLGKV